jgi:hypothetical protein
VAVADGMAHFDGAGLDHDAVQRHELGLIVLAETLDELPEYCGTILQITPDGRCQVSNHLGEQVVGTPIGVTAGFAAATAAVITDAVGDEPELIHPSAGPPPPSNPGVHRPDRDRSDEARRPPPEETERGPLPADDFADELSTLFGPELPSAE